MALRLHATAVFAAGLIAASALVPAAAEPAPRRAEAKLVFTTQQAGAPTGLVQDIRWRNPADPGAKPHAVRAIVLRLHPGSVIDTSAIPRCEASDPELIAQGPAACPGDSRLGGGVLRTDTGSAGLIPRFVENEVTTFNADGEVIVLAESSQPPTRAVSRARIEGETITTEVPPVPGNPPPDPYTAFTQLRVVSKAIVRSGRAYGVTPKQCPPSGSWINRITLVYRDDVREDLISRSPCRREARPRCGGRPATIVGTARGERLEGTRRRDVIVARGGGDRILGGAGADLICAGAGSDRVTAGRGADRVWGGLGDDRLVGRRGADRLIGGPGRDHLRQ